MFDYSRESATCSFSELLSTETALIYLHLNLICQQNGLLKSISVFCHPPLSWHESFLSAVIVMFISMDPEWCSTRFITCIGSHYLINKKSGFGQTRGQRNKRRPRWILKKNAPVNENECRVLKKREFKNNHKVKIFIGFCCPDRWQKRFI